MDWESKCHQCGECCFIGPGDPCSQLEKVGDKYHCKDYENRLGRQRSVGRVVFNCVPIASILDKEFPGKARCGYITCEQRNEKNYMTVAGS